MFQFTPFVDQFSNSEPQGFSQHSLKADNFSNMDFYSLTHLGRRSRIKSRKRKRRMSMSNLTKSHAIHCVGCNSTFLNISFWDQDLFGDQTRTEDDFFEINPLPLSFVILMLILYGIVVVVSFGGNIVVCYTICDMKALHTVTNFFLASLSISDVLATIFSIPTTILSNMIYQYWVLGSFMCPFMQYLQLVVFLQRAFSMVAITCDRNFVISRPLHKRMTKRAARLLVVLLWVSAFIIALPTAIFSQIYYLPYEPGSKGICIEVWSMYQLRFIYNIMILLLQYFMPLLIMICAYVHIGYMIWNKTIPGEADKRRDRRIASSKRKVCKISKR